MGKVINKTYIKWTRFFTYMGLTAVILFAVVGSKNLTNFFLNFDSNNDTSSLLEDEWLYPRDHYQFDCLSHWQPNEGQIIDFHFQNNNFFVLTSKGDLYILNYNNPKNPEVLSKLILDSGTSKIYVSGNFLYTASSINGISIFDITQIRNPRERYHFRPENTFIHNFIIEEQFAYLAKGIYGLEILDLSDKFNPISVLTLNFEKEVQNIVIHDSLLFLAVKGLVGPTNFNQTSFLNPLDDIMIRRETYGNGLIILDIENIISPKLVSYFFERCNYLQSYLGVSVNQDYVHLVDGMSGLKIIDIKDIYHPTIIGEYVENEYYIDLATNSNYTFISTYEQGLQVFDTSNKTQPIKIAQYFARSPTLDLYLGDNFASIANQMDGLVTINFDRDEDKIDDLTEISEFNTDPNTQDTDADELSDHEEIFIFGTDPTLKDTDQDRFDDFYEIQHNHDPLDPEDHPLYFSLIALFALAGLLVLILLSFRFAVAVEKRIEYKAGVLKKKLAIKKNNELRLLKLLYLLEPNDDYSFRVLAKVLRLRIAEINHIFRILEMKGCIERIGECNFKKGIFTKKKLRVNYKKKNRCYYCNTKMSEHQIFCKKCNNNKFYCRDCHHLINYSEPIGICPICLSNFHLEHILEKVHQDSYCPVCFYEIYLNEIAVIIPYKNK